MRWRGEVPRQRRQLPRQRRRTAPRQQRRQLQAVPTTTMAACAGMAAQTRGWGQTVRSARRHGVVQGWVETYRLAPARKKVEDACLMRPFAPAACVHFLLTLRCALPSPGSAGILSPACPPATHCCCCSAALLFQLPTLARSLASPLYLSRLHGTTNFALLNQIKLPRGSKSLQEHNERQQRASLI